MKKQKEPSLLRQIISIHFEQARRRRELRRLQKQSWSFDFLALLLVKASKLQNQNLELVVTNKDGISYKLSTLQAERQDSVRALNDSILDHLDDDMAVNNFIRQNSVR